MMVNTFEIKFAGNSFPGAPSNNGLPEISYTIDFETVGQQKVLTKPGTLTFGSALEALYNYIFSQRFDDRAPNANFWCPIFFQQAKDVIVKITGREKFLLSTSNISGRLVKIVPDFSIRIFSRNRAVDSYYIGGWELNAIGNNKPDFSNFVPNYNLNSVNTNTLKRQFLRQTTQTSQTKSSREIPNPPDENNDGLVLNLIPAPVFNRALILLSKKNDRNYRTTDYKKDSRKHYRKDRKDCKDCKNRKDRKDWKNDGMDAFTNVGELEYLVMYIYQTCQKVQRNLMTFRDAERNINKYLKRLKAYLIKTDEYLFEINNSLVQMLFCQTYKLADRNCMVMFSISGANYFAETALDSEVMLGVQTNITEEINQNSLYLPDEVF